MLTKLSLINLYNCKSHIGYSRDSYFRLIKTFIFATKVDYFILDVIQTLLNLKLAIWFSFYIAVYSNKMLFVHNLPLFFVETFGLIFKIFGHFTLKTKWRSGTLTNFRRIRKHYRYLYTKYIKDYKIYKKLTFFTYYNKKLAPQICDFLFIRRLPSLIVALSSYDSEVSIKESYVVRIPSLGFNSNRNVPMGLTFPIISNDVSEETFIYYLLLYKNIMFKSLFYRRLDFFTKMFKNMYLNLRNMKKLKLQICSFFFSLDKSFFFKNNLSSYKSKTSKYNKPLRKKISYLFFVKYRKKKYFFYKNSYFFYRKEKKKRGFYLKNIFSNFKIAFIKNIKYKVKGFFNFRNFFFTNIFFHLFSKKKYRLKKKISLKSKKSKKVNLKLKKKKNINLKIKKKINVILKLKKKFYLRSLKLKKRKNFIKSKKKKTNLFFLKFKIIYNNDKPKKKKFYKINNKKTR